MEVSINITLATIIDILSIATALMLGLLFVTIKSNNKANYFLAGFLWSLSLEVLDVFSNSIDNLSIEIPQTSLITIPFLIFYVHKTLNKKIPWFHLLLFLPGILVNLPIFTIESIVYLEYAFNLSLLIVILNTLKKHQKHLGDFYSDLENKTLSWIKMIVFIFLAFHLLWIIEDIIAFKKESWALYFAKASTFLTFFMIYWIGYNGFSQQKIFTATLFLSNQNKLKNTSETQHQFEEICTEINRKKLFLKTDLNLTTLAVALNLKEKELSKLINLHTNENFYHFINQFRVNEFKRLLSSSKAQQLSLLGIANEAGFFSKSTFYTAFKKLEGTTPKQYQNQLKKSE